MTDIASRNEYHEDRMKRASKVLYAIGIASEHGIQSVARKKAVAFGENGRFSSPEVCRKYLDEVLKHGEGAAISDLALVAWAVLEWFNVPKINRMASNPK